MEKRESNFELLRILSMLMIIIFHCVFKSGFKFGSDLGINEFAVKIFWLLGELGVNLFVLISGYFMINGTFRIKKLVCLVIEVWFYSLFSYFSMCFLTAEKITVVGILTSFFPVIINRYWFATAYIMMYIFSPYLNIFINAMSKKQLRQFLIIILAIWCVLPTIFGVLYNSTESSLYYNRFIWLVVVYFVGAYIRLYPLCIQYSIKKAALLSVGVFALMVLSIPVLNYIRKYVSISDVYLWTPNNIFMLCLSVLLFITFSCVSIPYNKIINKFASACFGVYLFHDGKLNSYIWAFFNNASYIESPILIIRIVLSAFAVYIVGCIIDFFRQIIEKTFCHKCFK